MLRPNARPDEEGIETRLLVLHLKLLDVRTLALTKKGLRLVPLKDEGDLGLVRTLALTKKGLRPGFVVNHSHDCVRTLALTKKGLRQCFM